MEVRLIVIKKLLFLSLFIFCGVAHGAGCGAEIINKKETNVLFVNGILNDYMSACSSLRALKQALLANGLDTSIATGRYNYQLFWNPTEGGYADVNELRLQGAISSVAQKLDSSGTTIGYYGQLGSIYNNISLNKGNKAYCLKYFNYNNNSSWYQGDWVQSDDDASNTCSRIVDVATSLAEKISNLAANGGVVVVAHSQGNFYLEAAYSLLTIRNDPNLAKIKGVGVAAISSHPVSGRYLTISQDNALFALQKANMAVLKDIVYQPAPATHTACISGKQFCNTDQGQGENYNELVSITGTANAPSYLPLPEDHKALLHEFTEVYLNNRLTDDSYNKIALPTRIASMVKSSIEELNIGSTITSITPNRATVGIPTTFTITGTNLPTTHLYLTINRCDNLSFITNTTTQHTFFCTPTGGDIEIVPRTSQFTESLGIFPITVSAIPSNIVAYTHELININNNTWVNTHLTQDDIKNGFASQNNWVVSLKIPAEEIDNVSISFNIIDPCVNFYFFIRMNETINYPNSVGTGTGIFFDGLGMKASSYDGSVYQWTNHNMFAGHYIVKFSRLGSRRISWRTFYQTESNELASGEVDSSGRIQAAIAGFNTTPIEYFSRNFNMSGSASCRVNNLSIKTPTQVYF